MRRQQIQIGTSLKVEVTWYDTCPVPPRDQKYEGEVIGWRDTQLIVSVKDYAVLRFWKKTGIEVGNKDHQRRGFRVDLSAITESTRPAPGVAISFSDNG